LLRKTLCAYLAGAGSFGGVTEFDSILDFIGSNQREPLVLVILAGNPSGELDSFRQLRHLFPQARSLFLVDDPDEEFPIRALEAGAWGCLSTAEAPQNLIKAVRKVAEGERWFDHRVTNAVHDRLLAERGATSTVVESLTPREWEVLALIAEGHTDKEVASSLFISRETEQSHVKSIYRKLQVSTRREAAVCYFKHIRGRANHQSGEPGGIPSPGAV
jgi:DNA-binding NarL/FixJ family response regulator